MTRIDTSAIIALAKLAKFTTGTRDNGSGYVKSAEDAPEWQSDVVCAAHGGMLPDDYRYEMIRNAFNAIAEAGEDADLDDVGSEFADGEPSDG